MYVIDKRVTNKECNEHNMIKHLKKGNIWTTLLGNIKIYKNTFYLAMLQQFRTHRALKYTDDFYFVTLQQFRTPRAFKYTDNF